MNDVTPQTMVPTRQEDADLYLHRIGELSRQLDVLDANHEEMLATLERTREKNKAPLVAERDALVAALREWAAANRHELTRGGRTKRVLISAGAFGWRKRPAKVVLHAKPKDVVAALKQAGLNELVRLSEAPDKQAILKHPSKAQRVPGVEIERENEDFFVEPGATK